MEDGSKLGMERDGSDTDTGSGAEPYAYAIRRHVNVKGAFSATRALQLQVFSFPRPDFGIKFDVRMVDFSVDRSDSRSTFSGLFVCCVFQLCSQKQLHLVIGRCSPWQRCPNCYDRTYLKFRGQKHTCMGTAHYRHLLVGNVYYTTCVAVCTEITFNTGTFSESALKHSTFNNVLKNDIEFLSTKPKIGRERRSKHAEIWHGCETL